MVSAAFTKGCTIECRTGDDGDKIPVRRGDFMASTDPIEKNTDFAKAQEADFPLLSESIQEVATPTAF